MNYFRIPHTEGNLPEKQKQTESYLQQFIQELNYVLGDIDRRITELQNEIDSNKDKK